MWGHRRGGAKTDKNRVKSWAVVGLTALPSSTQTAEFYTKTGIFCFPSVREFGEAVVLEVMTYGLLCIVADNGGIAGYVTKKIGFKIASIPRENITCNAKMSNNLNLTILPSLQAKTLSNKQILIAQKFLDGVLKYVSLWPGSITVLMEENTQKDNNLDNINVRRDELPFKLEIISFDTISTAELLNQTSVVLATVGYRQNHISKVCQSAGIPCIYISEYSLRTRKQIVAVTTRNPLLRLRRNLWEDAQESKQRKAVALANGLQCNGTPTYNAYRTINCNPLLFFDTRVTEDMLTTNDDIEMRVRRQSKDMPLRLLFSGRLIKMKGADHLLDIAQELKRLGIRFQMFICGDGELKEMMQHNIAVNGLGDCVKMMGVLEFKTELIPFVKANVDLFICCHRQGDPSCTYLETMSCGVPIVGYANEAFAGIVEHSKIGWLVEMDRPKLLAKKVAELSRDRERIKAMSFNSLRFAGLNTFEKTFEARISHIERIAMSSSLSDK